MLHHSSCKMYCNFVIKSVSVLSKTVLRRIWNCRCNTTKVWGIMSKTKKCYSAKFKLGKCPYLLYVYLTALFKIDEISYAQLFVCC